MRAVVEAILFDIDGTLVDSTGAVERAWKTWADRRGLDVAEILRVCHGRRSEDTVAQFVPPAERASATAELTRLELDDLSDITALPGARYLWDAVPPQRRAVVTSGPRQLMQARLDAAGLSVPAVMITAENVARGKPDPEGYRKAAAALGWDAGRCLVIEDAPAGVEAGRAAGSVVLAVATTHRESDLQRADGVVPNLTACTVDSTDARLVFDTAA